MATTAVADGQTRGAARDGLAVLLAGLTPAGISTRLGAPAVIPGWPGRA
jgi:hypothetical protein